MADYKHDSIANDLSADAQFWTLAEELMTVNAALAEGKIMSSRCLRLDGDFLAMITRKSQRLVIKLDQARVTELIDTGKGLPFAPAKKVFKEWVEIKSSNEKVWKTLLLEAIAIQQR